MINDKKADGALAQALSDLPESGFVVGYVGLPKRSALLDFRKKDEKGNRTGAESWHLRLAVKCHPTDEAVADVIIPVPNRGVDLDGLRRLLRGCPPVKFKLSSVNAKEYKGNVTASLMCEFPPELEQIFEKLSF